MIRNCKVIAIQNLDYTNREKKRIKGQLLAVREDNEREAMDKCYLTIVWAANGAYVVGDSILVQHGKFGDFVPKRDSE